MLGYKVVRRSWVIMITCKAQKSIPNNSEKAKTMIMGWSCVLKLVVWKNHSLFVRNPLIVCLKTACCLSKSNFWQFTHQWKEEPFDSRHPPGSTLISKYFTFQIWKISTFKCIWTIQKTNICQIQIWIRKNVRWRKRRMRNLRFGLLPPRVVYISIYCPHPRLLYLSDSFY